MKYFIGIDMGSTHVKVCLTDEKMNMVKIAADDNRPEVECDCGLCYDSRTLWERICHVVKEVVPFADDGTICAIGVTSMADSGLPVDAQGNGLYPIIPWYNNCGIEYKQHILAQLPPERMYDITGQCYHPKFALSRLLYLQDKHPRIFKKMRYWLSVYDFILHRLTGEFITDSSLACRTMLYNIGTRDWEDSLVEFAGVKGRLPHVLEMGDQCGVLTAQAAELLGLPEGVPVVCGGHDHLSAMKAVHLDQGGDMLNSLGTSEVFVGVNSRMHHSPLCMEYGINQGCYADGKYYWMANLPSSGASVEWLRRILSVGELLDYKLFSDEDKLISSNGVMFIPHINGSGTPHPNPQNNGMLLGLTSATTIYHIIKAVYEGISYETRWILDSIEKTFDIKIKKLVAVSGGSRNKPLMKAKADVTGRVYSILDNSEVTLHGAVMQAALAVGMLPQKHIRDLCGDYNMLLPQMSNKLQYDMEYAKYRRLHEQFDEFADKELCMSQK
jgi:xylulokinase